MPKQFPKIHPKDFKSGISLFLLTAVVLLSYLSPFRILLEDSDQVIVTTPVFFTQIIAAHVLLLSVWVVYFFTQKLWKTAFAIYLIISLTPFLELTNNGLSFSIGSLSIDLIAFFFLMLHIAVNPEVLRNFSKFIKGSDTKQNELNSKTLKKFEKRFETKSEAQLQNIATSTDFSPEAQMAAKNILEKKSSF